MAKFIIMPKMGNTVTTVIFSEWYVKEGDQIKPGDKLFSYETDKTTTEEIAKEQGTILKLLVKPDQEVAVFAPVMIIGQANEDISDLLKQVNKVKEEVKEVNISKPSVQSPSFQTGEKDHPKNPEQQHVNVTENQPEIKPEVETLSQPLKGSSEVKTDQHHDNAGGISPRALKALRKSGVSIDRITYGSGPRGRIVSQDITKAMRNIKPQQFTQEMLIKQPNKIEDQLNKIIEQANTKGQQEYIYPPMRAAISKGMRASQSQSAFVTLTISIDAYQLLQARKKIKANVAKGQLDISINDLIIFACSRVLPKYKQTINAHVFDTKATIYSHANIAVAVDTPIGLIVPVIKETNLKSLAQISQEAKEYIAIARQGKTKGLDLSSGTFTISNVGGMGIEVFTPVLNAGQAAILGIGTTMLKPRKNHEGLVEFYNAMILSLTIDHRLADGADGARFLNDLKLALENIETLINLEK